MLFGITLLGMTCWMAQPAGETALNHEIKEPVAVGTQVHTKFHLVIRGRLRMDSKEESMAGQALLEYPERVLEVGTDGLAQKVVRYYEDARAKFVIARHEDPRQLRVPLRIVVGRWDKGLELWSPAGPFTSDERELVEDVFDTTRVPGLLPKLPLAVGATYEPDPAALLAAAGLKHFISSTVKGKLVSRDELLAVIQISGDLHGLSAGTEVKSKIDATLKFSVPGQLVEDIRWNQVDQRGPSPISPPGSYEVKITLERKKAESPRLTDSAIAGIKTEPAAASKLILFSDPNQRFRFHHGREWHVTLQSEQRSVLRLMNDGDFIAQLNVTTVEPNAERAKMTAEQLQAMVEQAGGWNIEEVVRVDKISTDGSFDLQLLIANGTSGKLKLRQRHYLATLKSGRQVIFSFLVEPQNEEKLGTADQSLVSTIEFPTDTASRETPKK